MSTQRSLGTKLLGTRARKIIAAIVAVVVLATGSLAIAAATGYNPLNIFFPPTRPTLFTYRGHTKFVASVAWSPDGKRLASSSDDGTVQIWDANNGGHTFTYRGQPTDVIWQAAWSPDGKRIASASADGTVHVWDARDGGNVLIYRGHSPVSVLDVVWSPDGKRLASASDDGTVQVWNASDGGNVFTYRGHSPGAELTAVAWSPDGKQIASAGDDRTVQV